MEEFNFARHNLILNIATLKVIKEAILAIVVPSTA
jgi:hypothetical protein